MCIIVCEISSRGYEKLYRYLNKTSLILRQSYANRGYRYWFIRDDDNNLIHGFVVMQQNIIIAMETWPKRHGYGKNLIQHLKILFKDELVVHYSSDDALSFYEKMQIPVLYNN